MPLKNNYGDIMKIISDFKPPPLPKRKASVRKKIKVAPSLARVKSAASNTKYYLSDQDKKLYGNRMA